VERSENEITAEQVLEDFRRTSSGGSGDDGEGHDATLDVDSKPVSPVASSSSGGSSLPRRGLSAGSSPSPNSGSNGKKKILKHQVSHSQEKIEEIRVTKTNTAKKKTDLPVIKK
jgi:hypothetical protein